MKLSDSELIKRTYIDVMNDPELFSEKAVNFVNDTWENFTEQRQTVLSPKQREWCLSLIEKKRKQE